MSEISQQIAQISTKEEIMEFLSSLSTNPVNLSPEESMELDKKYQSILDDLSRKGEFARPLVQPATREAINRIRNSEE